MELIHFNTSKMMSRHLATMKGHSSMVERLRKTLYYGNKVSEKHESIDYPSMPLTELTVQMFEKTVTSGNKGLDVFDMNFASHVSRQACISPCSIMMAMIYLKRLKKKNPEYLRRVSTCDLFLVSMMIASKFLYDDGEDDEVYNDEWAASGGMDVKELNRLEREFLEAMDWTCFIDYETFMKQLAKVEAAISLHQFSKRGSNGMTYSELLSIFNFADDHNKNRHLLLLIAENVAKVVVISLIAYSLAAVALITLTNIRQSLLKNTHIQTSTNETLLYQYNQTPFLFEQNFREFVPTELSYNLLSSLVNGHNKEMKELKMKPHIIQKTISYAEIDNKMGTFTLSNFSSLQPFHTIYGIIQ